MKKETIRKRLYGIIDGLKSPTNDAKITDSSNIRNDIGLESIDYLDMILQTEIAFGIKINPQEAASCVLVSDYLSLVEKKVSYL